MHFSRRNGRHLLLANQLGNRFICKFEARFGVHNFGPRGSFFTRRRPFLFGDQFMVEIKSTVSISVHRRPGCGMNLGGMPLIRRWRRYFLMDLCSVLDGSVLDDGLRCEIEEEVYPWLVTCLRCFASPNP